MSGVSRVSPAIAKASAPKPIRIEGGFEQWRGVGPEFLGHAGDTIPRDFDGACGLHYVNRTGRNDLLAMKVARDETNLYFYLRDREPIAPAGRMEGLWLLLATDHDASKGWEGSNFLVGRFSDPDGAGSNKTWGGGTGRKWPRRLTESTAINCTWRFRERRCNSPAAAARFRSISNGPTISRNPAT